MAYITSHPFHTTLQQFGGERCTDTKMWPNTAELSVQERLSEFPFEYHITPHLTMGVIPSELLMKRRLRSRLHLIHPEILENVGSRKNRKQHMIQSNP